MKQLMKQLIEAFYILFGWQWFPPYALASLSLVGIVATVVDPWCYLSGCMAHCEFAVENAWGDYGGKWGDCSFLVRDSSAQLHFSLGRSFVIRPRAAMVADLWQR